MKSAARPPSHFPQIDLHGRSPEEAILQVDRFIQHEFAKGSHWVKIIHGNGSGALRHAVREYLNGSPLVEHSEAGLGSEGGTGVLIVTLEDRT